MYYASNILKLLQKNYRGCQDSKKKITEAEIAFAEKLVSKSISFAAEIRIFCIRSSKRPTKISDHQSGDGYEVLRERTDSASRASDCLL